METGETACIIQTLSGVTGFTKSAIKTEVFEVFQYYESGAPTMIRTWDPQIRNLVLYPTELPGLLALRKSKCVVHLPCTCRVDCLLIIIGRVQ